VGASRLDHPSQQAGSVKHGLPVQLKCGAQPNVTWSATGTRKLNRRI
jgi:hypothetical protein